MRLAAVIALALLCSGSASAGPAAHPSSGVHGSWEAVLRDAYDGTLDTNWACAPLREAVPRLPRDKLYSSLPEQIEQAAGVACDRALLAIHVGSSEATVLNELGTTPSKRGCWSYAWTPARASVVDGACLTIAAGHVTFVKTAVHG